MRYLQKGIFILQMLLRQNWWKGGAFFYLGKVNIAPRVSLAYKTGKSARLQWPMVSFTKTLKPDIFLHQRNWIIRRPHITSRNIGTRNQLIFRAEIFYKKYDELDKNWICQWRDGLAINNNGFGDAKGFELFWRDKKTIKNLDYWISYSYLDTKRDYLNFPLRSHPILPRHILHHCNEKICVALEDGIQCLV